MKTSSISGIAPRIILMGMIATAAASRSCQAATEPTPPNQRPSPPRTSASAPATDLLTAQERAWLREHPVIRLYRDPQWPPVEFVDAQGEPAGITNDYLGLVEQRLGITFERVQGLDWNEAYDRMKHWDIDMTTCLTETPGRRQFWAFTKPYMTIPVVIVTRANVTYVADMHELAGRKVAVVDGYFTSESIPQDYPEIQLVRVKTVKDGLDLLETGEVFAVVDSMLVIGHYMTQLKLANLKVAGRTPYASTLAMAVRKDWPVLADILQKALNSISDAERAEIYKKWVPIRYEYGFDYRRFWQALAVFVVILAGLGLWIRKLSEEIKSRKAAEAALRQSEEKHRLLFDIAGDAIFIYDEQAHMLAVNRLAMERLGYTRGELMSMSIDQVVPPEERRHAREHIASLMKQNDLTFQTIHQRKDKSLIPIEVSARRIVWAEKPAIMSICRDITDRKRAEEERQKLQSQLFQAQKMESVGQLAGGVAHDFNNMLAVILGYTEIALEQVPASQPLHADLEQIQEAAQRSAALTRQLLAFARKQPANPKVLNLNETVSGMFKMLQRLIGEDIHLIWKPGADTWPIRMDPTQIDQILANLAINARDAMPQGGKLIIETRNSVVDHLFAAVHAGARPGEYVQLTVSDTGIGMDRAVLEHLFEPFFTTKEAGKGTGLGTATVYGITTQNAGFISVYSEPSQGTSFKVYLPRCAGEVDPVERADQPLTMHGSGATLLLVEDEPAMLKLGKTLLEQAGYCVLAAASPAEAIQIAGNHKGDIHLTITDVVMPEMNGADLVTHLLSVRPNIKSLYMSGYTADAIANHGVLEEGIQFIQKPFRANDLVAKVREVLEMG